MVNDKYEGMIVKGVLTPASLTFPKDPWEDVEVGQFAIFKATIESISSLESTTANDLPYQITGGWVPPYSGVVFKGKVPGISPYSQYIFKAKLVIDQRYGYQFNLITMDRVAEISDEAEFQTFCDAIFTERAVALLREAFPTNLKEVLDSPDCKERLKTIKGIGSVTAAHILEAYEINKAYYKDFVILHGKYGLTQKAITRLKEKFGSTEALVKTLEENPYVLMEEDGYGWIKCDALALASGYNPLGEFRVQAYIKYFLQTQAESNGHSWVTLDVLVQAIKDDIGDVNLKLLQMWLQTWTNKENNPKIRPWLYYEKETRRIGLMYLRNLENSIAKDLYRLQTAEPLVSFTEEEIDWAISESETSQGWEYTDEQRKAIVGCLTNGVTIVTGSGGCVDKDTEFFNGKKWKPISEYNEDDMVLQYNIDGTANLVKPLAYIKAPCDYLWLTQSKYGVDMCLSDEHRVIYQTSKRNLYEKPMIELKEKHENSVGGFSGKFYTVFDYDGEGIELTDVQIKIMCAVICDGSFIKESKSKQCRFHIKKDRKKERLREIFTEAQVEWREHKSAAEGYTDFYIEAPIKTKIFDAYWYQCNKHQLQIICDNILFWDGNVSKGRRRFASNVKENADFVQFAFTACGERATITQRSRVGQSYYTCGKYYTRRTVEYNVGITERTMVSIGGFHRENHKTEINKYKTIDGYKYCFTLPSGMWVMRRNGKILITGNSGKTSIMLPIAKLLRSKGVPFGQCSLAGKAASNLSEVTNVEGKTIHRLLGLDPETHGFSCNRDNPLLERVIILDELSMVGAELFYDLIQAIPNGAKLIMLGDSQQLEAIGYANLLKDCVDSHVVPCYKLTKIHRQAQRSAIITESLKVADGKQIIGNSATNEVRGELQDLKIVTYHESEESFNAFIREYKELLNKGISFKDILGVVPMRTRGSISCLNLNKEIQSIVNGSYEIPHINIRKPDGVYDIKVGDKVVNRKNRYDTEKFTAPKDFIGIDDDRYAEKVAIFNGNVGYVTKVMIGGIVIDFLQQGEVFVKSEYTDSIELGYVLTAHSAQGSQSPNVIVGIDMSAYTLLSKEWIYTAITRARKYCVLCGQISAIKKATSISRVKVKQTWLTELLRQNFQQ